MTLQQLTYLVTVADCGNITEAAEKLFISQPSLSAAIHNLEKEMGVTAFTRSNKGVTVTREGEELLSFARMLLEQADNMKEHFGNGERRTPKFSVSCQHYSFAVNAFVDLIKEYDADQYSFIIRETQTGEIIEDVASGKSEIGVLYLSEHNEDVILKLIKNNQLKFEEMFVAEPHVFICKDHPLAKKEMISMEDLQPYPYLVYEQGNNNSFYFSQSILISGYLNFLKKIHLLGGLFTRMFQQVQFGKHKFPFNSSLCQSFQQIYSIGIPLRAVEQTVGTDVKVYVFQQGNSYTGNLLYTQMNITHFY